MTSKNNHVSMVLEALLEAGRAIMQVYGEADFGVQYKEDASPVTRADIAASNILSRKLSRTAIPIICEEVDIPPYDERKDWKRFWLVDPLDGTKEFISRNGEFTVNVGLIEDNLPAEGYILIPVQKTMYWGRVNEGCYKASYEDLVTVSAASLIEHAKPVEPGSLGNPLRVVSSRSHAEKETWAFIDQLKETFEEVIVLPAGSSLKFCYVAEGRADVYVRFSPTMEWDTAAGHAIALASGANISSLSYNKPVLKNGPLMVCNPKSNLVFRE